VTLASHALAPEFTYTSAAPDATMTFASGTSPITASTATGTYRMWLAPKVSCFPRDLATRIKAAIATRGASPVVTASLSADGILSMTFKDDIPATITFAADVWRRLGFASASPTITTIGTTTRIFKKTSKTDTSSPTISGTNFNF
jgi:hypothetical protein